MTISFRIKENANEYKIFEILELNHTVTKMKNPLEGLNSRLELAEESVLLATP